MQHRIFPLALLGLFTNVAAIAADTITLPPVNLGSTSFLDGIAKPASLIQVTGVHFDADRLMNHQGKQIAGDNRMQVSALTVQLAHISKYKMLGGYYGAELIVPVADIEPDTDIGLTQGASGLGDVLFSPFLLQWNNQRLFGKPLFHRLNFLFRLPTGDYDKNQRLNVGKNAYSFNPYYAATVSLTPKWSTSFRFYYLWNAKNNDPALIYQADNIQAGSAFHMNYAFSYQLKKNLYLGISGYYLKQLRDDHIGGQRVVNSRESVFAIGPGLVYRGRGTKFKLNAYLESGAKNRPEGLRLVMGYTWYF